MGDGLVLPVPERLCRPTSLRVCFHDCSQLQAPLAASAALAPRCSQNSLGRLVPTHSRVCLGGKGGGMAAAHPGVCGQVTFGATPSSRPGATLAASVAHAHAFLRPFSTPLPHEQSNGSCRAGVPARQGRGGDSHHSRLNPTALLDLGEADVSADGWLASGEAIARQGTPEVAWERGALRGRSARECGVCFFDQLGCEQALVARAAPGGPTWGRARGPSA